MRNRSLNFDTTTALSFLGQTVLMELRWEDQPDSFWMCVHIVGVVLPMDGVYDQSYFMTLSVAGEGRFPNEVFFSDIYTIRAIRHRDRHSSGNVLGRMTRPFASRSGAALPAHRDGSFVAMNGGTGAAHP